MKRGPLNFASHSDRHLSPHFSRLPTNLPLAGDRPWRPPFSLSNVKNAHGVRWRNSTVLRRQMTNSRTGRSPTAPSHPTSSTTFDAPTNAREDVSGDPQEKAKERIFTPRDIIALSEAAVTDGTAPLIISLSGWALSLATVCLPLRAPTPYLRLSFLTFLLTFTLNFICHNFLFQRS